MIKTNHFVWPCDHRFSAAFFAIAFRFAGDNAAALAGPPLAPPNFPSATAAGFFTASGSGGASPVAMSTINFASWFTSRGRFGFDMLLQCH